MMFTFFIHMNFYCVNGSVWPLFLCFWQICAELEVMGRCFRCIVMFKLREWRLFVIRPIRIDVLYELYAWSASKTQIVIHFLGVSLFFVSLGCLFGPKTGQCFYCTYKLHEKMHWMLFCQDLMLFIYFKSVAHVQQYISCLFLRFFVYCKPFRIRHCATLCIRLLYSQANL